MTAARQAVLGAGGGRLFGSPDMARQMDLSPLRPFEEKKKLGDRGKQKKRKRTPIEEKESFRWLNGYREACAVAAETPDTTIVCISDSEGDIYECFAEAATGFDEDTPKAGRMPGTARPIPESRRDDPHGPVARPGCSRIVCTDIPPNSVN